jgi:ABC-type multidrug transport system fused ATPase/permease subunit
LEVNNLSFSYHNENDAELHLNNICFSINHSERVALVGETGSGKTTFLKIMRDLYHPRNLTLSVDGQIIPQGFEGINRAITLVQQDPEILAKTVGENITMGAEYDSNLILKYTNMACFTDVVLNLPKKFDSSIKEKGINLSGGQQQRLALSRGLLACHDKDIVLLDEPTSSLDTITEITVYQNIFREFKDKTIISTIHQLHLLPLFDRICVFDNGQIVGSGTLQELLTSCPKFVSLWEAMQRATTRDSFAVGK